MSDLLPLRREALVSQAGAQVDLRLAPGVVLAWGLAMAGAAWSASAMLWWVVLMALVLSCTLAFAALARTFRRVDLAMVSRLAAAVALAAACLLVVAAPLAARLAQVQNSTVRQWALAGSDRVVLLQITDDPRVIATAGAGGGRRVMVDGEVAGCDVLVFAGADGWGTLGPGQRVQVEGRFAMPAGGSGLLAATLTVRGPPVLVDRGPWWQRAAASMRTSLRGATAAVPEPERGLLPGLVDGDTSTLDPVLAAQFRVAGLTHLVAVSGANCVLLVGAVLLVLRRMSLGPVTCALLAGLVLVAFVVVARPSPSVLRAAGMTSILLVSQAIGRPRTALPALFTVVLALLSYDATLAADAGFAMSVLATAALILLAPRWSQALRRRRVPRVAAEAIAVATAAHLVTAPVVAALSGALSLVAVPANVLAEPVVLVVTVLGFCAAVLAPLWSGGASVLMWLASWPARWLVMVAEFFGTLDGATVPWPAGAAGAMALAGLGVAIVVGVRHRGPRRMLAVALLVAGAIQIPLRPALLDWPVAGAVLVACDVGQGDGLVLPIAPGVAVVVDVGPDPIAMDRCLRQLNVTKIPLIVLTHLHADHVDGISGAMRGRTVDAVATGPLDLPVTGLRVVDDALAQHHLPLGRLAKGQSLQVGDLRLDVLGPPVAYHGTRSDPNNSSVVMRATIHGARILLMGDAEQEAQQALLDEHVDLSADVLKVAHHGSKYSQPALLAQTQAKVAVISVGAGNDYGLPAPTLLDELKRLGIPTLRTDLDGDVAIALRDSGQLSSVRRGVRASQ